MTPKEIVSRFFQEGYTNRNYAFVMDCMSENYIDHSPAGARSNGHPENRSGTIRLFECENG